MIPFEELCDALARWRSRNGLANGPSAQPPKGAFVAVTTEEILAEQPTTITANPLSAGGARPVQEHTNEIEVDSVFLDEDDI
jgi:hypothetical protein